MDLLDHSYFRLWEVLSFDWDEEKRYKKLFQQILIVYFIDLLAGMPAAGGVSSACAYNPWGSGDCPGSK